IRGGALTGRQPFAVSSDSLVISRIEPESIRNSKDDPIKTSLRKACSQGRHANSGRSAVATRPDERARGGGSVAEGCGPDHGAAQVVWPRPSKMEAVSDPLSEGTQREERDPQDVETKKRRTDHHFG